jgi:hypothetical protein
MSSISALVVRFPVLLQVALLAVGFCRLAAQVCRTQFQRSTGQSGTAGIQQLRYETY